MWKIRQNHRRFNLKRNNERHTRTNIQTDPDRSTRYVLGFDDYSRSDWLHNKRVYMMEFIKYPHVERIGTTEVDNIIMGECYVFPKIDGTNASLWWNETLQAGSRTRHLTTESDNAGFYSWALEQECFKSFFAEHPTVRLYGEWLVPHSLKTYRSEAWRRFYVFDVAIQEGESQRFIHYDEYKLMVEKHGIDFIPPLAKVINGSIEQFTNQLQQNVFMIEDGKGAGEGIVIKRYDFVNKFGRTSWAKIVTSEFKEKHTKEMGVRTVQGERQVEMDIADTFVTTALVEKEYAKIALEEGWSSKLIPRLLNTVFYCIIKEEAWEIVKRFKNPTIDFKQLQFLVVSRVKQIKPELF